MKRIRLSIYTSTAFLLFGYGGFLLSQIFKNNQKIVTPSGVEYIVLDFLGSGGQGEVYNISSGGKNWALKWYYPHTATDSQRKGLEALVSKGAPTEKFLWPLTLITDQKTAGFGYIMPLRPKNYKNIVDLMKRRIEPSFYSIASAGFQLSDSYYHLHLEGLSYRDISFGNVFFDPQNGEVFICDNDNVNFDKTEKCTVYGTPRFMAPEIVRGDATPSADTDRFSLAVLLFYMFFISHPLEGKKESAIHALDAPAMKKIYGDEPVFIFDPNDSSNAPDPVFHNNALVFWQIYPQFFKDLFTRVFTQGIRDPENGRVRESEWRSGIIKLRDSIVFCQKCGCENFYDPDEIKKSGGISPKCWNCKIDVTLPPRIKMGNLIIMLNHNTKLYPYHLDPISYNFSKPIAEIGQHPANPQLWGLKNISDRSWQVTKPDGTTMEVPSGKNVSLGNGIKVNFGQAEGEIRV
jgi:serine/threonine protein kinase